VADELRGDESIVDAPRALADFVASERDSA
jgi:hypothetical protein